jgi:hypothetical protein
MSCGEGLVHGGKCLELDLNLPQTPGATTRALGTHARSVYSQAHRRQCLGRLSGAFEVGRFASQP